MWSLGGRGANSETDLDKGRFFVLKDIDMEFKGETFRYRFRLLLGTIVSLMGADGIVSHFLIRNNWASEANPLIRDLILDNNFPLLKIGGAIICVFILGHAVKIKPVLISYSTCIFVLTYTLIVYWNLLVFFAATSWSLRV
jgi:hypothetical protein